jgi:hypothetical protein
MDRDQRRGEEESGTDGGDSQKAVIAKKSLREKLERECTLNSLPSHAEKGLPEAKRRWERKCKVEQGEEKGRREEEKEK